MTPLDKTLDHLRRCAEQDIPAGISPESARQIVAELGTRRQWQSAHKEASPECASAYLAVRALANAGMLPPNSDPAIAILEEQFHAHESRKLPVKAKEKTGGGK